MDYTIWLKRINHKKELVKVTKRLEDCGLFENDGILMSWNKLENSKNMSRQSVLRLNRPPFEYNTAALPQH
jgi:hypothetical protein